MNTAETVIPTGNSISNCELWMQDKSFSGVYDKSFLLFLVSTISVFTENDR